MRVFFALLFALPFLFVANAARADCNGAFVSGCQNETINNTGGTGGNGYGGAGGAGGNGYGGNASATGFKVDGFANKVLSPESNAFAGAEAEARASAAAGAKAGAVGVGAQGQGQKLEFQQVFEAPKIPFSPPGIALGEMRPTAACQKGFGIGGSVAGTSGSGGGLISLSWDSEKCWELEQEKHDVAVAERLANMNKGVAATELLCSNPTLAVRIPSACPKKAAAAAPVVAEKRPTPSATANQPRAWWQANPAIVN